MALWSLHASAHPALGTPGRSPATRRVSLATIVMAALAAVLAAIAIAGATADPPEPAAKPVSSAVAQAGDGGAVDGPRRMPSSGH